MACFVGLMRGGPPRRHPMSTDSKIDLDLRAVEISAGDLRRLRDRGGDRHQLPIVPRLYFKPGEEACGRRQRYREPDRPRSYCWFWVGRK
jgi:hypothetical protein